MTLFAITSLLTVVTASTSLSLSLFARNNPPQPPCVYPYTKFVYSGCFADSVASRALPFKADLEFNNATVEQCTSYCKGNNYRYAGLEYHGQCFCGASVSATTAPEAECNLPCNGDSNQSCGGEDRVSIYQDPTFTDADDIAISSDFLSLGCYTEGDSGRSLDYSQWDYLNISAMTTETCLDACGAKGFPFAGTEFGRECYCGVVLGNGTIPTDSTQCSTPCTGNSTQYCGGADRLSLYVAKNLKSTEPCGPPIISSSSIPSSTPTPSSLSSKASSSVSSPTLSSSSSTPTPSSSSIPPSTQPPSSSKPTSSKPSSSSVYPHTTTSKCLGYHCPKTTASKTSFPLPTEKTTSTSCKTTLKPTSTAKSTAKPSSSTKKPTLKTSPSCTTTPKTTAKSTAKTTLSRKYGGW